MGHDLKNRIEELIPVYNVKYSTETLEYWKLTYFEKADLEQCWTNFDKYFAYAFKLCSGWEMGFTIDLVSEFN